MPPARSSQAVTRKPPAACCREAALGLPLVAPPRLTAIYVDNPKRAADQLGLRPAERGGNVLLAEPFDPVVFERTTETDHLAYAALPQVAADLLTSPGRGPSEAEELLEWMRRIFPSGSTAPRFLRMADIDHDVRLHQRDENLMRLERPARCSGSGQCPEACAVPLDRWRLPPSSRPREPRHPHTVVTAWITRRISSLVRWQCIGKATVRSSTASATG